MHVSKEVRFYRLIYLTFEQISHHFVAFDHRKKAGRGVKKRDI